MDIGRDLVTHSGLFGRLGRPKGHLGRNVLRGRTRRESLT